MHEKEAQTNAKDIFLLREEILHIVESLSFQCLTNDAQIKLDIKQQLPEKLSGDAQRFRLAIQSIVEFVGRYARDGIIDFVVNFDGFTDDQRYNISFDVSFNKNSQHNETRLI